MNTNDLAKKALEDALKAREGLVPIAERSSDPNKIAHLMEKLELFMAGHELSKHDLELLNSNSSLDEEAPKQESKKQSKEVPQESKEVPKQESKEESKKVPKQESKEESKKVPKQESKPKEENSVPQKAKEVLKEVPEQKASCYCKYKLDTSTLQEKSNDELSVLLKALNVDHALTNISCQSWSDANRNSSIILLGRVDTTCKCTLNGNVCNCADPDVKEEVERPSGFVIKEGINHHNDNPVELSVRTHNVVKCFHIDEERDVNIGIQLSKMNLNYVFKKKSEDVKLFHLCEPHLFGTAVPVLPSFVDLRSKCGTVYNQLNLGSCTSNSTSKSLFICMEKEGKPTIIPSRLFIYYNGRVLSKVPLNQDTGLSVSEAFDSVAQYSVCSETVYPYNIAVFANKPSTAAYQDASAHTKAPKFQYLNISSNLNQIQQCLNAGYAIPFGTSVYSSFMTNTVAKSGIIPVPNTGSEQMLGGHSMALVGYINAGVPLSQFGFSGASTGYGILLNSWGSGWGKNGFALIPYAYLLNQNLTGDFHSPRVYY